MTMREQDMEKMSLLFVEICVLCFASETYSYTLNFFCVTFLFLISDD